MSQFGLPRLLLPYELLRDWEEQQDDSTKQLIKQLKDLEKRVRAL